MVRDPDDLGDWNVRARDSASGVFTSGIKHDGPEGGQLRGQNASLSNKKLPPPLTPDNPHPTFVSDVNYKHYPKEKVPNYPLPNFIHPPSAYGAPGAYPPSGAYGPPPGAYGPPPPDACQRHSPYDSPPKQK